jgi:hypothetical protein
MTYVRILSKVDSEVRLAGHPSTLRKLDGCPTPVRRNPVSEHAEGLYLAREPLVSGCLHKFQR